MSDARGLTVAEISARLAKEVLRACADLLPLGRAVGDYWIDAARKQGGLGDSLMVRIKGAKQGRFNHYGNPNDPRAHGDLLDLASYVRGYDLAEAVAWGKALLNIADRAAPAARAERAAKPAPVVEESTEEKRERALKLWHAARPIAGTLAEIYLKGRGHRAERFGGAWPASLGFLPALRHPYAGVAFPVLLACVQRADGEVAGVWRIYLDRHGAGKAPVEMPRLGLGPTWGGAVRLVANPIRLVTAEGVETAMGLVERQPGWGLWATLSANNLWGCVIPDTVKEVIVASDHDATHYDQRTGKPFWPGQDAARRALKLHRQAGRRAAGLMPGIEGLDFDDLARMSEEEGV